jgi:hypothetical protein
MQAKPREQGTTLSWRSKRKAGNSAVSRAQLVLASYLARNVNVGSRRGGRACKRKNGENSDAVELERARRARESFHRMAVNSTEHQQASAQLSVEHSDDTVAMHRSIIDMIVPLHGTVPLRNAECLDTYLYLLVRHPFLVCNRDYRMPAIAGIYVWLLLA